MIRCLVYKLPPNYRCFSNLFYRTVIDTVRRLCSLQRTDTQTFLLTHSPCNEGTKVSSPQKFPLSLSLHQILVSVRAVLLLIHGKKLKKKEITSRERPKSAPYLRLKNNKRTSKCQSILFYSTRKTQKLDRIVAPGGPFEIFFPFCRKSSKKSKGTL